MLCDSDGYNKNDAILAVDSLNVDWNEQAVRTAKDWLEYSGYSRNRLIETLCDSDGYTKKEAIYGVDKVGLD